MGINSLYYTGPVTALCCYKHYLLAGIGSQVNIFDLERLQLQQIFDVLPARVIHGFSEDEHTGKLCVFGEKSLRLLEHDSTNNRLDTVSELIEFPDWIWDVAWRKAGTEICLALGHNVIVTFDIITRQVVEVSHCADKCILYCAKFLSSEPDCLVLAAGTVFNQVVIWSAHSARKSKGRIEPFHRLTGHQGVIFNVDYNTKLHLICSVSDDRSIRLYKVRFAATMPSAISVDTWETMETCVVHVLYGHSGRVWDARLLSSCIVSVAEDSTCCVWSYEGHVIQKFKGHKGKSIWSMCSDKGEQHVVTGGGDNSVRMWSLNSQGKTASETKSLDMQLDDGDFARNTMLLDVHKILVITNSGNLLLYNQKTSQKSVLMSDALFSSYTVVAVSRPTSQVALGNIHGTLRVLTIADIGGAVKVESWDRKVCEGKILSIHWLDDNTLLATAPAGLVTVWQVMDDCITDILHLELPASKQRWVSTALLVTQDRQPYMVCGDRTGSVFLYNINYNQKHGQLVQTFAKLHGKAGVTHISSHGDHVYSAGRDGMYRTYSWTLAGQLMLLNTNRVCKGLEWIERLDVLKDTSDILVQGFYTNLFVVWSVQQNQKLLEVNCGGGHRAWQYCCHGNTATFVYVKAREVMVTSIVNKSNQVILKGALHGRELCSAKLICVDASQNGRHTYAVVTCSEDTAVCLSALSYKHGLLDLKVCQTMTGHISSVRCLAVCKSSKPSQHSAANRKLIFTGGGRAQLKVWRVAVSGGNSEGIDAESVRAMDNVTELHCTNEEPVIDKSDAKIAARLDAKVIKSDDHAAHKLCSGTDNVTIDTIQMPEKVDEKTSHSSCIKRSNKCVGTKVSHSAMSNTNTQVTVSGADCTFSYECLAGLQLGDLERKRVKKPWRHRVENSDPETRILDLTVISLPNLVSFYLVAAACSDGKVRLFCFDEELRDISLLASSQFHDHCVLKVTHMLLPSRDPQTTCAHTGASEHSDEKIIILSSATDGKVAFWDITPFYRSILAARNEATKTHDQDSGDIHETPTDVKTLKFDPFFSLDLHQSGINGLHIANYGWQYLLLTGGDDNALKVTCVTIETSGTDVKVTVVSSGAELCAHSAQITGVWYIEDVGVLSASIDQRICMWKFVQKDDCIQLRLVESFFTSVSDVANVDVCTTRGETLALVCGCGMELLNLTTHADNNSNTSKNLPANLAHPDAHDISRKSTSHADDRSNLPRNFLANVVS